ncbi:MAG: hypothetical protein AAF657_30975 [Acidobacteriota bacterium]
MHTARTKLWPLLILWMMMLAVGTVTLADDGGEATSLHSIGPPGDFEAEYVACDEFAGVGLVPMANVIDRVPEDYTVIEPVPGLAVIVAQAGSCAEIVVDGGWSRPGIFAQFGVAVVPPLAPGNGDFYQIFLATDHPRLAVKLRRLGVNARFTPQLSYEIDEQPALAVDVPKPPKLAFELSGLITLPDPTAPPNPTSVFNYYAQTRRHGNVLQQNVVEGIRLGEGSAVVLTAIGPEMQAIVGGEILMFPFFSSPEVFDHTALSVVTDAF